jgi:hypothetical protein
VDDGNGLTNVEGYWPGGPENGLPLEGTDSRRPLGVAPPQETGREVEGTGDCIAEPNRLGLPLAVENVADVGVVAPLDWVL